MVIDVVSEFNIFSTISR